MSYNNNNNNVLKIEVAVVGHTFTGKSTLCYTLSGRTISMTYDTTIGIDLISTNFDNNGIPFKLLLWDMSGNEIFSYIIDDYIKKMSVVLYCYSANEYMSFVKMKQRYKLDKENGRLVDKHIVISMCKCESIDRFNNLDKLGQEFCKKHGYDFIPTSSTKKIGLVELMSALTKKEQQRISLLNKPTSNVYSQKLCKCTIL